MIRSVLNVVFDPTVELVIGFNSWREVETLAIWNSLTLRAARFDTRGSIAFEVGDVTFRPTTQRQLTC